MKKHINKNKNKFIFKFKFTPLMTRGWPFLAKQIISDTQGELAIYQLKKIMTKM